MIGVGYTFEMPGGSPALIIADAGARGWLVLVTTKNGTASNTLATQTILTLIQQRQRESL